MDPQPSLISKSKRSLKIVYDDPDATDSSSDERIVDPRKRKRVVFEISFPNVSYYQTIHNELNKNNKSRGTPKHEVKQPSCKYKGVRIRQWARYAAEIRNPINGRRNWLGTFDSAEEASKAYEAKRHEFETIYKKDLCKGKKRNKRFKKVSFDEPIVSSDGPDSSKKLDISHQPNFAASVDTSPELELDWLACDGSEIDLNDNLGCVDDLNDIDIPFDFDYFGTQFAVYHGISSSIKEPRNLVSSSKKERRNIPEQ